MVVAKSEENKLEEESRPLSGKGDLWRGGCVE